ncbi:MAG: PFL family protein [Clostridia bacterium]|nr:PFL family protein [Clostridia bacterium]
MLQTREILETINMVQKEHLDVRTLTMGISLLDCVRGNTLDTVNAVTTKIYSYAKDLVKTGQDLQNEFGIPIVNKRISLTPLSLICGKDTDYVALARAIDKVGLDLGVDFIGGYTALVHKGMTDFEKRFIETIPEALAVTDRLCSSVNIGSTKAGINMDAVRLMGEKIKETAYLTKDKSSIGCAKLVVFCNAVEDNPFMAGAFHGIGEAEKVINVGVSGPGVVHSAIKDCKGASFNELAEIIKKTAFKITRVGQLMASLASERTGATCGIVDLSLAPTPVMGDSVAHVLESMGIDSVGGLGTTAALAMLNDAVKKGGLMASSSVGGLSGAFIPVSEDIGMINAVREGLLSIEKLEAMTAVCSVGLDMIAVPGSTTASQISGLIADEAAIGMVNNKTTAVRVIPVEGQEEGEVEFGGLLGRAPLIKLSPVNNDLFIARGGKIPAPLHSLKN